MEHLLPIHTAHLFPILDELLVELLRGLSPNEWEKPTIAGQWRVKDVAAHLLDGNIRSLSMLRDNYFGEKSPAIHSYHDLVGYLNQLNADWVRAMRRTSPGLLIDLLETTGRQYSAMIQALNPMEEALFSVAWAGEDVSKNWFHIAREYTEKWHHQQQIRLAVGKEEPLLAQEYYLPYLETSMRALPHHYHSISARTGTAILFHIKEMGEWRLVKTPDNWQLAAAAETDELTCEVFLDKNIAWRMFTKGIGREEAASRTAILGDEILGEHILTMLAVMA